MTLAFFAFGLPLLLGYALFVGITGRLNPIARPNVNEELATWFLALWTGVCVSLVLSIALFKTYGMPVNQALALLPSTSLLLATLLIPALALYVYSRNRTAHAARASAQKSFNWSILEDEISDAVEFDRALLLSPTVDISLEDTGEHPADQLDNTVLDVSPAYLETIRIDKMPDVSGNEEAVNDSKQVNDAINVLAADIASEEQSGLEHVSHDDTLANMLPFEDDLQNRLSSEIALRQETEQHLRITRKALSVLEAETRHHSNEKADALIELEEQLAASIEQTADAQTDAMTERQRRIEVEQSVVKLKRKMVKAKQDIRRGAAARATALSTANKSIAFARQSVQIRGRLENELDEAHSKLSNRQKTISSLIRALEKEKRKTQSEVAAMAQQLVLHEKQMTARRTLEEVARSVENKLTSRLVKKVAKARPIASDMNPG